MTPAAQRSCTVWPRSARCSFNVIYRIPEEEKGAIWRENGVLLVQTVAELFKGRLFLELYNVRGVVEFVQLFFGGVGEALVNVSDLRLIRPMTTIDEGDHELALLGGIGQLLHLALVFI